MFVLWLRRGHSLILVFLGDVWLGASRFIRVIARRVVIVLVLLPAPGIIPGRERSFDGDQDLLQQGNDLLGNGGLGFGYARHQQLQSRT